MPTCRVASFIPTPPLVAANRREASQTKEALAREFGMSYATWIAGGMNDAGSTGSEGKQESILGRWQ